MQANACILYIPRILKSLLDKNSFVVLMLLFLTQVYESFNDSVRKMLSIYCFFDPIKCCICCKIDLTNVILKFSQCKNLWHLNIDFQVSKFFANHSYHLVIPDQECFVICT